MTPSVIVPLPGWTSVARQCLGVLMDTLTPHPDAEILLVAEPSTVPASALAALGERVRLVPITGPLPFAAACNQGAAVARGDALVFLPHNTEPQPGWLAALLAAADAHPEAALIGSRLLALDDTIDHAGFLIARHGLPVARYRGFPGDHPAVTADRRLAAVGAAGLLVRRAAFDRAAGFDTAYRDAFYDADLCLRVRELGKDARYCPSSTLYHFAVTSPEGDATGDEQLFSDRWKHRISPDDIEHYLDDGLIRVTYQNASPLHVHVSPLLGLPDREAWDRASMALLDQRARQVHDLLAAHTRHVIAESDADRRSPQTPIETMATTKLHALLASDRRLVFPAVSKPRVSIVIPLFNQAHFIYLTLETLLATPVAIPFEVIVVDDGSTDATPQLLERLDGVNVFIRSTNGGFGAACNDGAERAQGKFICFLNSDIVVTPGWLDALVEVMEAHPECGAVGGKLVFPDGTLQEAGSILWGDGSALGYGRGAEPDAAEYSYAREVDYCSAACLLIRKDVHRRVGGFDPCYAPAYYEDVDLCLRIWSLGMSVWYAPHATVLHLEHASSGHQRAVALQLRNRTTLMEIWPDLAQDHGEPSSDLLRWRDRRRGKRVLVIDDLVPRMELGSGFPRTVALLDALAMAGYLVTYLPSVEPTPYQPMTRLLQARGIEVLHGRPDVIAEIMTRRDYYEIAIVSRPHNAPLIPKVRAANRGIKIIYDAEALFTLREANQARVDGDAFSANELDQRIRAELALVGAADLVLTVSDLERSAIQRYHPHIPIAVWGHAIPLRSPVPGFQARRVVGFVGYLATAPNNEALLYLIQEILPFLATGGEIPLLVAGGGATPQVQEAAANGPSTVTLLGYVEDLSAFYDECRVFVAPHRFAAGIPLKVVEAMANGVPCVISPILAEQLGVTDEREVLVGADPEHFAVQVTRLYSDEALWQRVEKNARRFVGERYDPARMRESMREQVDRVIAGSSDADAIRVS